MTPIDLNFLPLKNPASRGALANWIIRRAELRYKRLYDTLNQVLRGHWLIHGDETNVQVLKEKDRKAQDTSYMRV